jgi:hypothetical protein
MMDFEDLFKVHACEIAKEQNLDLLMQEPGSEEYLTNKQDVEDFFKQCVALTEAKFY